MTSMVDIPFEGEAQDRAVVLLAAAEKLGHPNEVVGTTSTGFKVPEDVAKEAGLSDYVEAEERQTPSNAPVPSGNSEEKQEPAKKAPAKKAAAKKAPAKKAAARKSTAKKD